MTCRHAPGDPQCSSHPHYIAQRRDADDLRKLRKLEELAQAREQELLERTPDPDVYEVLRAEKVGTCLVVLVQYTSCRKCSFDAKKVMVFADTTLEDAIRWKRIDPHFSEPDPSRPPTISPPPRARFIADDVGWADAVSFANSIHNARSVDDIARTLTRNRIP